MKIASGGSYIYQAYLPPTIYVQGSYNHGSNRENQNPRYGTNNRPSDWIVHQQRVCAFCRFTGGAQVRYRGASGWQAIIPTLSVSQRYQPSNRRRDLQSCGWFVAGRF